MDKRNLINKEFWKASPNDAQTLMESFEEIIPDESILNDCEIDFLYKDKDFYFRRVIWSTSLGIAKGGLRFNKDKITPVSILKSLSVLLIYKSALFNLPYSGSAGEIHLITDKKTKLQALKKYTQLWFKADLHLTDILSPDMGTSISDMSHIYKVLSKYISAPMKFLNGKPVELGGCEGRDKATSYGAEVCIEHLIKKEGSHFPKKGKVSFFGFGNSTKPLYSFFTKLGYTVVAISNSQGFYYDPVGIKLSSDYSNLKKYNKSKNPKDIFNKKTDIFVAGYKEDTVDSNKLLETGTSVFIEIANNPLISKNINKSLDKKILRVPGILINSGGFLASHYENMVAEKIVKNNKIELYKFIKKLIKNKTNEVLNLIKTKKYTMPQSAFYISLKNIKK